MTYFDLPKNEMVGYSPLFFRERLFKTTIPAVLSSKNKNKTIEIIENRQFVKYSYKQISEMYYASIYALAINKQWNIRHEIISSDSPDIIFVNKADQNDRVAIEIYEGFDFPNRFSQKIIAIKNEVQKLYNIKGNIKYAMKSRLLVVNKKESGPEGFNVSEYCRELNKYTWNFSNIILCIFRQRNHNFTFFYVYPKNMCNIKIDFVLSQDSKFWY